MGKREDKITAEIKKYLDSLPRSQVKYFKISDRFTSGVPDFILNYRGCFLAVEVKRTGGKPRKLQAHVIKRLNEVKEGAATSVDNVEDLKAALVHIDMRFI